VSSRNGQPSFVRMGKSGEFWPIILEKAWAKLVGSYMATVAGTLNEGLDAVTGAPILTISEKQLGQEEVWKKLLWATRRKYPMGAGSNKDVQILQGGHAYAILEAYTDASENRVLKMFDPWNKNRYTGELPNQDGKMRTGMFSMTFNEYLQVFSHTAVALLHEGYKRSKAVIAADAKLKSFRFTPKSDAEIVVYIQYPSNRFLECGGKKEARFSISTRNNLNRHAFVPGGPYVFKPVANQEYTVFAQFQCSECNANLENGWVHLAVFSPQYIGIAEDARLIQDWLQSTQKKTWGM